MRIDLNFVFTTDQGEANRKLRGPDNLNPYVTFVKTLVGYEVEELTLGPRTDYLLVFEHSGYAFCRFQVLDAQDAVVVETDVLPTAELIIPLPVNAAKLRFTNPDGSQMEIKVLVL